LGEGGRTHDEKKSHTIVRAGKGKNKMLRASRQGGKLSALKKLLPRKRNSVRKPRGREGTVAPVQFE